MEGATATLEFLCRAKIRLELLRELDHDRRPRVELEADLDRPKSTVARNLAKLAEHHLVSQSAGQYDLTPLGRVAASGIDSVCDVVESPEPLHVVSFLGRAENRMTVLQLLGWGSLSRDELINITGIPRTTIRRVLSNLTDVGFIQHLGGNYATTDPHLRKPVHYGIRLFLRIVHVPCRPFAQLEVPDPRPRLINIELNCQVDLTASQRLILGVYSGLLDSSQMVTDSGSRLGDRLD